MRGNFEEIACVIKHEFALLNSQLEINIYETPIESELFYFEQRVYGYLNVVVASKWTNFYFQQKSVNYLMDAYESGVPVYTGRYEYEVDVDGLLDKVVKRFFG